MRCFTYMTCVVVCVMCLSYHLSALSFRWGWCSFVHKQYIKKELLRIWCKQLPYSTKFLLLQNFAKLPPNPPSRKKPCGFKLHACTVARPHSPLVHNKCSVMIEKFVHFISMAAYLSMKTVKLSTMRKFSAIRYSKGSHYCTVDAMILDNNIICTLF